MTDERDPLTPWQLRDRFEAIASKHGGARLTPESVQTVLEALRAYCAHPRRDKLAAIICVRTTVRRAACTPLCRRCSDLAYELKCMMRGEPDVFGDRGWYDGGHRVHRK